MPVACAASEEAAMQTETFEYITDIYPERELQGRLDELGSNGWELITAHWEEYSYGGRSQQQARCILKRRVLPRAGDDLDDLRDFAGAFKSFGAS